MFRIINLNYFILAAFFLFAHAAFARAGEREKQKIYNLDEEIVVTASALPTAFSHVARTVQIITAAEIKQLPVSSVQELLAYSAGIDLKQRGPDGVQTDVSIRGATFEQTSIMIDGVKINDPQTGHHSMNLPIGLDQIEKIEVLKGPGSRLFGPNAFGGVINIITRKGATSELTINGLFGQNNYRQARVAATLPVNNQRHLLSVEWKGSDGYRKNTDFDYKNASYSMNWKNKNLENSILAGFSDRAFGANSFYHPSFPDQWERTKVGFVKNSLRYRSDGLRVESNLSWRYHDDEFMLDRKRPEFYHNHHFNNELRATLQASLFHRSGITTFGAELAANRIRSNNLGNHSRSEAGLFAEHQYTKKRWHVVLGGSAYRYSDWGWYVWPGLDVRYRLAERASLYASAGSGFRVPTYTELYYHDRANVGNPDLKAEKNWNYEMGYRYLAPSIDFNLALFYRDNSQLIDWVWSEQNDLWNAMNYTSLNTWGLDIQSRFKPDIFRQLLGIQETTLQYSYLSSDKNTFGRTSKYALSFLRHQAMVSITQQPFHRISQTWILRYENHLNYGNRYWLDGRLGWSFPSGELFISATNLLNRGYEDYFAVRLPGRWLKVGMTYHIF